MAIPPLWPRPPRLSPGLGGSAPTFRAARSRDSAGMQAAHLKDGDATTHLPPVCRGEHFDQTSAVHSKSRSMSASECVDMRLTRKRCW